MWRRAASLDRIPDRARRRLGDEMAPLAGLRRLMKRGGRRDVYRT